MTREIERTEAAGFVCAHYGRQEEWSRYELMHPMRGKVTGKHFLRQDLGLTGMEMSLSSIPEGEALSYFHAHIQNEELYLFLSGRGEMKIGDRIIEVREGTAVRVLPAAFRSIRSLDGGPLNYIVIQAKENSLEQCNRDDAETPSEPPEW